eukprot:10954775-Heterocapsa_arctica.AAC.1
MVTLDQEPFAWTTYRGATLKGWEPADPVEERRFRELACQAVLEAVEGRGEVPFQKLEESLVAAAQGVEHSTLAARSKAARQPTLAEQEAKWTWKSAFGDHRPGCKK